MTSKIDREESFRKVLELLRSEAKKFGLMVELVESLASKYAKEDDAQTEDFLFDYVPWVFSAGKARWSRGRPPHELKQVKSHLEEVKRIFDNAKMREEK